MLTGIGDERRRQWRTAVDQCAQPGGDWLGFSGAKRRGRRGVYIDAEDWNKHRGSRSDSIAERNRASAGFLRQEVEHDDVIACVIVGPSSQRERKQRGERGRSGDDDGPFLGWPGLELGCGQFFF